MDISAINLTPVVQAVITLLATLITCWLIPWIKARTTAQQQETMRALVRTLVFAAEQIYGEGKGQMKLQYVEQKLKAAGYTVNADEIEAAVCELLNLQDSMQIDICEEDDKKEETPQE